MEELTEKEQGILQYIKKCRIEHGYAPSVRDIQREVGIKSTSTVHSYIEKLSRKGFIQKEDGKSRTLRLDEDGDRRVLRVPVLGPVAAGLPLIGDRVYDEYVDFSCNRGYRQEELFALRIRGDSMTGIGIFDGDAVVVKKQDTAVNGNIVVAMIDGEMTVKTFYDENGHIRLQPENKAMKPIIVDKDKLVIKGRVIADVRYY